MNDREFRALIEASSLGTPTAKRYRRKGEKLCGITGAQARIDEVARQEREWRADTAGRAEREQER